ncbi:MAG: TIGR04255 family protein [Planctomycetes bacterium]|nr:TIGR04255 family protein [Planctomycetota bacterium]
MARQDLKNKPLVEAILEVKWALQVSADNVRIDPHYKLLVGSLYDRLCDEYPEHEPLPSATMPDEVMSQVVQHRFRSAQADWPLIQVGPGILTLNETQKYTWDDFRVRSIAILGKLFDAYAKPGELKIESLVLRYIDAVEFDYMNHDVSAFLKDKMKVSLALPGTLFANNGIKSQPLRLNWRMDFACKQPRGVLHLRFATGQRQGESVVLWETVVQSTDDDVPEMPSQFSAWLDSAHGVTHDCFFKIIEGELERRFRGE